MMRETAKFETHSFKDLLDHARYWKTEVRGMNSQAFSKLHLTHTNGQLQMYAISTTPGTNTQTIFSAPVPPEIANCTEPADPLPEIKLKQECTPKNFTPIDPNPEFTLLCERQRSQVVHGITDFEICKGQLTLLASDQIYRFDPVKKEMVRVHVGLPERKDSTIPSTAGNTVEPMDVSEGSFGAGTKGCSVEHTATTSSTTEPTKPTKTKKLISANFVSSAKVCPADSSLLAYVLNKQVYVTQNGEIVHRTTSDSKHITNGVASYIVQEELERFDGIWWSNCKRRLLYEHVNEEHVADAQFGVNGENPSAPMKYPRAGTRNAASQLRMVVFENEKVYDIGLNNDVLRKLCPHYEYITRSGFFSDGTTVWVQLMSRDQRECYLVLVPFWEFELPRDLRGTTPPNKGLQLSDNLNMGHWHSTSHEETMEKPPRGKLLGASLIHKSRNEYWINTHNTIYPLKIVDEEHPMYEFIYCLERPHGSCLSLISAELNEDGYCRHTEEKLLMAETYSINKSMGVVVDEDRHLVYYVANESSPTEWNLCVSSYRTGSHCQLTESGICFKAERANGKFALDLNKGFACWMTSVGSPSHCRYYSFKWVEGEELPEAIYSANVNVTGREVIPEHQLDIPEVIEYQSKRTGLTHYALILRPRDFDTSKKYPVFHYVYGGPGIQIVHNDYTWIQFIRFARLGYIVVVIDNRGSAHRGIEFEGHISKRMGTVEVEDQIEGLQLLAERTGDYMDLNRVVVHGWSYGGYMALQMLAKYPKMFCGAIAGGAVSDWRLYDTAYTERYMGFPIIEDDYENSSIFHLVQKFPDVPNRLMLVHGLMDENVHFSHLAKVIDECIKSGKWHELVIFPQERHGIRNHESSIYLDARMMLFAQTAIQKAVLPSDPNQRNKDHFN